MGLSLLPTQYLNMDHGRKERTMYVAPPVGQAIYKRKHVHQTDLKG
jgi:hypothetical protein